MKKALVPAMLWMGIVALHVFGEEPKKDLRKDVAVRVAFVPGSKLPDGESAGASMTELTLNKGGPGGADKYFMQVHAGVGDKFPISEAKGPILFEAQILSGDDNHLVFETIHKEKKTKFEVKRDKTFETEVDGQKYEFYFPSVSISGKEGDKPTSPQAMIIITRKIKN